MPSLQQNQKSGNYNVRFRFRGIPFKRSLKTKREADARFALNRVEETLALLERGVVQIPSGVDPADFILSGEKAATQAKQKAFRLKGLFACYNCDLPNGAKEENTLKGERLHQRHMLRLIGANTIVSSINLSTLQEYIRSRSSEDSPRGGTISPNTIKKEIATFRLIWNWAEQNEYVRRRCPTKGLKYPKQDEKPPFMTSAEIGRIVNRSSLAPEEEKALWDCLFLSSTQIENLLDEIKQMELPPFVYPMILLTAHAGARRSEIIRSQVDDLDFHTGTIVVREKKRSRKHSLSFRRVPMTARLESDLKSWLDDHPGGKFTISPPLSLPRGGKVRDENTPLTTDEATDHFKRAIGRSTWAEKLKGFHTLRHSFASNAAAAGVDPVMIDSWLGHQTEEMRNRYRHLFPNQQRPAIARMFS